MNTKKRKKIEPARPHGLIPGQVQGEKLDLLISNTSIRSENVKKCLHRHFVQGYTQEDVCLLFEVTNSNFSRDCKKIRKIAADFEQIKRIENVGRKVLHPTLGWVESE